MEFIPDKIKNKKQLLIRLRLKAVFFYPCYLLVVYLFSKEIKDHLLIFT
jgi:TRAP-type mannitol/chloroaromatic compound transport system permease small subunit